MEPAEFDRLISRQQLDMLSIAHLDREIFQERLRASLRIGEADDKRGEAMGRDVTLLAGLPDLWEMGATAETAERPE